MDVRIVPKKLSGVIVPPASKSMAHRLLIAAALADGESILHNISLSRDIEATLRCLRMLGVRWSWSGEETLRIYGIGRQKQIGELPHLDCGESGSTLRFLIPIALAVSGGGVFTGQGRLMERPLTPYRDVFQRKGIIWTEANGVLTVRGVLPPGTYRLPGDVSSQFFTGLLLALPLLDGESTVVSTTPLESAPYVTMTMGVLQKAGVMVRYRQEQVQDSLLDRFDIQPSIYRSFEEKVEADWSQGAFWYAAAALGSRIQIRGLDGSSFQGDRIITTHGKRLSAAGDLIIDLTDCPDLLPPLAVLAAIRQGRTRFTNAARLRLKESDRLSSTAAMLAHLGGHVEELPMGLIVRGVPTLSGGTVDSCNDHRIAMAAGIAATCCLGPVVIRGADAVQKSYPDFWKCYETLGGDVRVI